MFGEDEIPNAVPEVNGRTDRESEAWWGKLIKRKPCIVIHLVIKPFIVKCNIHVASITIQKFVRIL